jgi:hypothetical protein
MPREVQQKTIDLVLFKNSIPFTVLVRWSDSL